MQAQRLKRFIDSNDSSINDDEHPPPCETCDVVAEIGSIEDISLQADFQSEEVSRTETMICPNNDTLPPNLDHNLDNQTYISKHNQHRNESAETCAAYFPKSEVVQSEKDLGSGTHSVGFLENLSYSGTLQEANCNCGERTIELETDLADSVSNHNENGGAYMTKKLFLKGDQI